MLGVGWFGAVLSERNAPGAPRRGAARRTADPAASVLAMLRELSMSAAMRSDPEAALDRARPVYRAALLNGGGAMRLTDCLVGGVFYFARAVADAEAGAIVAPLACVATGSYAAGRPGPDAGVLLVIEDRGEPRLRGERVATLTAFMLGELEAGLRTAVRSPADCAILSGALPSFRRSLAKRRFLRGRHALFDALGRALEQPSFASRKAA